MTARVVRLEESPHRRAYELLPWYASGTLEGSDADMVAQHLSGCAACQRELAWLRELRDLEEPSGSAGSPEAALHRLLERIERRQAGTGLWTRASNWLHLPARSLPRWAAVALAAQVGVIGTLTWLLAAQQPHEAPFRTLSAGAVANGAVDRLVVVFDPGAPEGALRRLLQLTGAQIIAGPMASGAYVLAVPSGRRDAALERLRRDPFVRRVEALDIQGAPP